MKKSNFAFLAVAASVLMLSLTQCNTQPSASSSAEPSDSCRHSGLNVAYVDVDTLLTSYELWVSLNEDMINKRENITATVNKEGAALQKEMEQFQNKLNNNAFVSQERAESEYNRLMKKQQDLQEEAKKTIRKIEAEMEEVRRQIAEKHAARNDLDRQITRVQRQIQQRKAEIQELNDQIEQQKLTTADLQAELEAQQEANSDATQLVEVYEKKLILLQKKVVSDAQETKRKEDIKQNALLEKKFVDSRITTLKADLEKQRQEIEQLREEKLQYEQEYQAAKDQLIIKQKQRASKKELYDQAQLAVDEQEAKKKQQLNTLGTVQTEKNMGSRKLVQAQSANNDQQQRFKDLEKETDKLKETIKQSDKALLEENMKLDKEVALTKEIRLAVVSLEGKLAEQEVQLTKQKRNIKELLQIIQTSETQMHREDEEYKHVIAERQVLSAQLIDRDNELAGLYEKMVLQQAQLEKGEAQYNETMDKITSLKERIISLRAQVDALTQRVGLIDQMKREVVRLDSDIATEQLKQRSMEDELSAPINTHRWRILESTEPECIEILSRIHILQKKLIVVADEITAKNALIKGAEATAQHLQAILEKKPAAYVGDHVERLRAEIKDRQAQLKVCIFFFLCHSRNYPSSLSLSIYLSISHFFFNIVCGFFVCLSRKSTVPFRIIGKSLQIITQK